MIDTYIPLNFQIDPTCGIADRLRELVRQKGFIEFTKITGISKAQLSRYLNGTAIPSDRLAIIAEVCKVSSDWLLLGRDSSPSPTDTVTRLELFTRTLFDVLTTEYMGHAWKPSELAELLPLLILNDRYISSQRVNWTCNTDEIHRSLVTLETFRPGEHLKTYRNTINLMTRHVDLSYDTSWAVPLSNLLHRACIDYYNHRIMATNYYDRINIHMRQPNHVILQNFIKNYIRFRGTLTPSRILDIGCGTGRYISHIYRNHEGIEVYGIDTSTYALKLCQQYADEKLLPKGRIIYGDALDIPHENQNFDAVLCTMLLHYFPLIPGSTMYGVGKALSEIQRVLKVGGICQTTLRYNTTNEFLPNFVVCHPVTELTKMVESLNMRVISCVPLDINNSTFPGNTVPDRYQNFLMFSFQKQQVR